MVRAEDVANMQFKEKPYNSILPYLKSKQAEKKAEEKEKLTTLDTEDKR